ncbi:thioesterase family protein [Krasilnikovia sp. MM14-A1259]|uniref:thioesterase family protein n=1 Tax=Krasilnikovia sp. MM14-A1259 TaxID=3373539 RepID=UPI0038030F34
MAGFVEATQVAARTDGTTFDVELDPRWTIGDKPNGGYLLAVLARAATAAEAGAPHPHPLAASATYLAAPTVGPAVVEVTPLRTGRSASQMRARLVQGGQVCVEALFTLGKLDPEAAPRWADSPAVELPPEEDCALIPVEPPGAGVKVNLMEEVEQRLDPAVLGFAFGMPSERAELRGWLRFADGTPADPIALLFVADSFPPATLPIGSVGWVPTLELTVYVRAVPAPGPLRVRQIARLVEDGLVDEVCEVWDSRGRLVAQATQLAKVRF